MQTLSNQGILPKSINEHLSFCEHCVFGKATRQNFTKAQHTTKGILDYIYSNLWGPATTLSLSGSRYFLSLIHGYSRKSWLYFLKTKDQVFNKFKDWKTLVETQTNRKIKYLRTDNGLEFCSEDFNKLCKENGITRHKTVRHTPQQNGVAERLNRRIMERVRCLLSDANLGENYWAKAVAYTVFTLNRCAHTSLDLSTPEEKWSNHPPNLDNLMVFRCVGYVHQNQGKLKARAAKCMFVGFSEGVKGFKLWHPSERRFIVSRDVIFRENEMLMHKEGQTEDKADSSNSKIEVENLLLKEK